MSDRLPPVPPKKWKTALVIWIAIYPALTILVALFGENLMRLPLALRTLVMTGILVPLLVFVLVPALNKLLGRWLRR
ncbi:MAG TPA: hypothetical protein PKJ19_02405 [Flavobacteriales bacterium]|nr:hypothetical protein [Flavobacteriales bacterium]HNU55857.1 hypothetical protein [Flavobacteriales bacterium]